MIYPAVSRCCSTHEGWVSIPRSVSTCRRCVGCPDPTGHITTQQCCGPRCLQEHWKGDCILRQERRNIFRILDAVQELFFLFRENTFNFVIKRMERRDDALHVQAGPASDNLLVSFPNDLMKSKEEKMAVLSHLPYEETFGWIHEIARYLLASK